MATLCADHLVLFQSFLQQWFDNVLCVELPVLIHIWPVKLLHGLPFWYCMIQTCWIKSDKSYLLSTGVFGIWTPICGTHVISTDCWKHGLAFKLRVHRWMTVHLVWPDWSSTLSILTWLTGARIHNPGDQERNFPAPTALAIWAICHIWHMVQTWQIKCPTNLTVYVLCAPLRRTRYVCLLFSSFFLIVMLLFFYSYLLVVYEWWMQSIERLFCSWALYSDYIKSPPGVLGLLWLHSLFTRLSCDSLLPFVLYVLLHISYPGNICEHFKLQGGRTFYLLIVLHA